MNCTGLTKCFPSKKRAAQWSVSPLHPVCDTVGSLHEYSMISEILQFSVTNRDLEYGSVDKIINETLDAVHEISKLRNNAARWRV